ncbi:hypothetical protein V8E53_003335, partial [Lactarius tabidus]
WPSASLFAAGAETTSTTMNWWKFAMGRAHAELDTVVGRSRTPTFSDSRAFRTYKRWYNGMFIPKGALCLPNLWRCDDAAVFKPERSPDSRGEIMTGPSETREDGHGTYGFVGSAHSLFIYIATALWAATFKRARDRDGKEVPLDMEKSIDTGTVMHGKPVPYECRITPRFPEVVSILAAEEELLKT